MVIDNISTIVRTACSQLSSYQRYLEISGRDSEALKVRDSKEKLWNALMPFIEASKLAYNEYESNSSSTLIIGDDDIPQVGSGSGAGLSGAGSSDDSSTSDDNESLAMKNSISVLFQ